VAEKIVIENVAETVSPVPLFVAVTETGNVPAMVGVPLKTPFVESASPGGRPVAEKDATQ
jgi:hypothetical protein